MQNKKQVKKQKAAKKTGQQKKAVKQPVEIKPEEVNATIGDILDRIHKACDSRKLSLGSRRSAVSMTNTLWKRYGRLPTVEEVTRDAANPKQRGNARWLLKLIG